MKKKIYFGIDVSSATLDIFVCSEQSKDSFIIDNQVKSIQSFFKRYQDDDLVICMENTGRYNWFLYEVLAGSKHLVYVVPPIHIKKSMGLTRGKNDKIDAIRICSFIQKNQAELKPWVSPAVSIQKLKILLTERSARIKSKLQLQTQRHDYAKMNKLGLDRSLAKMNDQLVCKIKEQIVLLEKQIEEIIRSDESLKQQATLIRSVPGVGKVLCWFMLAKTEGFTAITDPRKMACYSGVVPFEYQSGTSIRGKSRVSVYADKTMKSVLHLGALTAIRIKGELRQYYERKVAEGKNKMSVINAVRNKIIHRIFAVIKSQKSYEFNLVLS
jgi:transposase